MNNKKIILLLFVLIALLQLAIPFKMILNEEKVISEGSVYKFKVAPVDPNDPFRGKYINLQFKEREFVVLNGKEWYRKQSIYVVLTTDEEGFMKIKTVRKERPTDTDDYVKANISYVSKNNLHISYPFNRYYMEESKAYEAEQVYNHSLRDSIAHETYAKVFVKEGKAVLQDVLIDGVSIREIVLTNRTVTPVTPIEYK